MNQTNVLGNREEILHKIATKLCHSVESADNCSLSSGLAGIALFLAEYEAHGLGSCAPYIERAVEKLYTHVATEKRPIFGLFGGIPGVAYALEKIAIRQGDPEAAAIALPVDDFLMKILETGRWGGHHDLVSGLVGIGTYASVRTDKDAALRLVELVTFRLLEIAEKSSNEMKWRTNPIYMGVESDRARYPEGTLNLGLAHGNPGALVFLSQVYSSFKLELGLRADLEVAIRGCANWILKCKCVSSRKSSYAYIAEESQHSRLAWCYGDLGVALSLIDAGKALSDESLIEEGIAIAKLAASREPNQALVSDNALCHGGLGVSLMFDRLYSKSSDTTLKAAASYWLNGSLEQLAAEFAENRLVTTVGGLEEHSLGALDGLASVGFCLLDSLSVEMRFKQWSRWLLI